ncbi:MAG TPA: glycosyltransferase family 4 protein [Burkholderiaceae bacterium]
MRILHVFKTYYPDSYGGVEQVIRQLSGGTSKLGCTNRVFTLSPHGAELPFLDEGGTAIVRAQTQWEAASTPISFSALPLFRKEAARADLIHYHYPWPFGDLLHLMAGSGKPALLTYHSDVVRQRTLKYAYAPLMRRFFAKVRAVAPTSPNYVESSPLLQRYRDKISVIPLGLDEAGYAQPDAARLEHWRREAGSAFFLFVGVLRYYKGLHILLEACAGSPVPVVIAGAGPMEAELKRQAARLGLTNVKFVGAVPDDDKIALLALCRGVVFPSHLRSEAFGITLLEGAMFGKPLISCEIGTGSSYVNIDGVTGIVTPPNDPAALRAAMRRLADDAALAEQMGRGARERFDTLFTADHMARSYVALYRKVLENR